MQDQIDAEIRSLNDEELEALFETIKEYFFYSLAEEDDLIEVLIEEALKSKKITVSETDFYDLVERFTECLHGMATW